MIEAKLETRSERSSVLDRPLAQALALDWEKVLFIVLIVAAFATRFYDLETRVMSHDESLHTKWSWNLYSGKGFQHTPMMHGPLQFHLIALSYFVFGDSDFSARVPAALASVASVGMLWFFRRWLGKAGALVAATLMLISPYMLYYGRYVRNEALVVLFGLLTAWAVFRYMETRETKWLYLLAAATALHYTAKETAFIYSAIFMLFIGLHLVREVFAVHWSNEEYRRPFQVVFWLAVGAVVVAAFLFFLGRGGEPLGATATVEPAVPGEAVEALESGLASPVLKAAAVVAGAAGLLTLAGAVLVVLGFGLEIVRRFPAMDLLVIFGTFALPQLAAFPVRALGWNPLDYASTGMWRTASILIPLALITVAIGLVWDWKKWLISAGIFYAIFTILYTTVFTNGGGFFTGMVGSLGYWLEQQGVRRGSQPWYYYILVQVPIYEFLPALGALLAGYYGFRRWWAGEPEKRRSPISPSDLLDFPVLGFIGFWAVVAVAGFSFAGEKMPWLTVHITLPLILLAGWSLGRLVERIDWRKFRQERGWIIAALLPLLLVALGSALKYPLFGPFPFQGKQLPQLQATSGFLSALAMTALLGVALYYAGRGWRWRALVRLASLTFFALLGVLTVRAGFIASYVNYDRATEFLVYAHGATGVKTVMAQIEEISLRTTDGLGVAVAFDDDVSWPIDWYLRDYYNQKFYGGSPTRDLLDVPLVIAGDNNWDRVEPLLGDRYYSFEYIRMWWPIQDYFGLTWERIKPAFTDPLTRKGIWQIWLNRNYDTWSEVTGTSYLLSQWPITDRMRFYIRKDVAAQIWDYGVGPAALAEALPEDPYEDGRIARSAVITWGVQGTATGQFDEPRGIAVGPDGSVYVADMRNHRLQKFDAAGSPVLAWGGLGAVEEGAGAPGLFKEPWDVAVGPDGSVYVADTWNHRIQKFDADGRFQTMWGSFGQAETPTAFWGPRGVAVDTQGRVFVVDTGNKRVVVFDPDGGFIAQIGGPGYEDGLLDEPVGIAVGPEGRVYVADTWNQRVQWFEEAAPGQFVYGGQWPIVGWYGQSLDNKPYLTVSQDGQVFVSDPEGYRILVFSLEGEFLATWGDFGSGAGQFALPAGLAVDRSGRLFVVDAFNHRVMAYPPWEQ